MKRVLCLIFAVFVCSSPVFAQGSEKTSFDEVTGKLVGGGDLYLYMSTEQAMISLERQFESVKDLAGVFAGGDAESGENFSKGVDLLLSFFRNSGLKEISGVGMSSIKRGDLYANRCVIHHYPGKDKGKLWSVFGAEPHAIDGLRFLPDDTVLAAFTDIDAGGIWNWVGDELRGSGIPELQDGFEEMLTESAENGFNLDRMISSIDGEIGLLVTLDRDEEIMIPVGGNQAYGIPKPALMLMVKVKDSTLFDVFEAQLSKGGADSEGMAKRADSGSRKILLGAMGIPYLPGPAVVVETEGYLMIASTMEIVDRALAVYSGQAAGLTSTAEFKSLAADVPLRGNGFEYLSNRFVETLFDLQKQALAGQSDMDSQPFGVFQKMFLGEGREFNYFGVSEVAADGVMYYSNSSYSVLNSILTQAFIGPPAIMAGMLLPALSTSRETARRISCSSNLKQIGLGLRMYSSDNDERFPAPDGAAGLEILRSEGYLENARMYTCPSADIEPASIDTPLTEDAVSYVYFGGFTEADSIDIPLAFDKPGNHRKYVNILFIDGHVEMRAGTFNSCEDVIKALHGGMTEDVYQRVLAKAREFDISGK